jgi:demethylmenaquinone methyltransferase/2-methoxy-6-polyprenyl-1,4-benzoquinol methylase
MDNVVKPYSTSQDKKTEVTQMFNNISGNYDFLNRFLSLGIDVYWRSRVIRLLEHEHPKTVLDVATGTADLAIGIAKKMNTKVLGVDISNKMIDVGHQKVKQESLEASVQLMVADSENLNFADNSYDAATVSFGVRNFENVESRVTRNSSSIETFGVFYRIRV